MHTPDKERAKKPERKVAKVKPTPRVVIVVSDSDGEESEPSLESTSPTLSFTLPTWWRSQRVGGNGPTGSTSSASNNTQPTTSTGSTSAGISASAIARMNRYSSSSEDDELPEINCAPYTQVRIYHGRKINVNEEDSQILFSDSD